jgi:two-component system nitrate/nitrite response regulator NarL
MSKTILVVDDQPMVRQGVSALIRNSLPQWEVCAEASNGKEALEVVRRMKPDLVVLDIFMPGMDGFEVASRMTRMQMKSRILVLSMHESKGSAEAVRKAGCHGFVAKAHAGRDLIHAIDTLECGGTFFGSESESPSH